MTRKITFRFAGPSLFALALAMPMAMSPIAAPPAHALFGIGGGPFIVYDPTNHAENLLTAARALEQINNQIAQLQNEAQMLINQARNLANLPYSALQQIQQNVSRTQQLLAQAQNIAFDVQSIDQMFQQDYGNLSLTATDQQLIAEARSRWENTVVGLQDAMRVQAGVVGNIEANGAEMSALVGQSQNAVGALQAGQVPPVHQVFVRVLRRVVVDDVVDHRLDDDHRVLQAAALCSHGQPILKVGIEVGSDGGI